MSARSKATLGWTPEGMQRRRCSFTESCTIGRDPANRVIVASPAASRRHASLHLVPGGLVLKNLSSSRPVGLAGRAPLAPGESARLALGDQLEVGGLLIEVVALELVDPHTRCVNPTCLREVDAHLSDCPWCGTSLAFAQTRPDRA